MTRICRYLGLCCAADRAAQIVEFAISLPLLLVFVVGIFDFSGAFTLRQKLTNLARDAARAAAADPANDLGAPATPLPVSVADAFQMVDNYFDANNLNDCQITSTPSSPPSNLTWTFSKTGNGCTGSGLTVIINRGYYFPANSTVAADPQCKAQAPGTQTAVISTCVSISYAYAWRFDRVITLLGSSAALPSTITVSAVAMNEN